MPKIDNYESGILDAYEKGKLKSVAPKSELEKLREAARATAIKDRRVKDEVALLSFRGREGSTLLGFNQLGKHTLRTFTGDYDASGRPVYSDGDVVAESVYRFKGQSAPAVVLAEIDFETLDDKAVRKLFVGATRASMKLVLVLSERAAGVLLSRM